MRKVRAAAKSSKPEERSQLAAIMKPESTKKTCTACAASDQPVVVDFRVEQEDAVYPMVPSGADLRDMIRRPQPSPIVETPEDP